jgi:hypothetical protein
MATRAPLPGQLAALDFVRLHLDFVRLHRTRVNGSEHQQYQHDAAMSVVNAAIPPSEVV